ncbi:MAG: hypothetical protein BroJett018_14390 [Chloroflexota bacterium]|nr:toll/interleukin-1 receptor domain-containing protein [Chloroflexota bacterium]GIK63645.1 MAG: hypothetical protein BroJett018_14390 [Chloroflexota bacterium]
MGHLFISYSKKDIDFARNLKKSLNDAGFDVWMDESEIHPGQVWDDVLQQNVLSSSALLVVMSSNSRKSDWVKNEVELAREKKIPIFPILLEGEVWFGLRHLQYEDMRDQEKTVKLSIEFTVSLRQTTSDKGHIPSTPKTNRRIRLNEPWAIIIAALISGICLIIAALIALGDNNDNEKSESTPPQIVEATTTVAQTVSPSSTPTSTPTASATTSNIPTQTNAATTIFTSIPTESSILTTTAPTTIAYPCEGQIVDAGSYVTSLNVVRISPSPDARLRPPVKVGDVVTIEAKEGETIANTWYQITYEGPNGSISGWIPDEYLALSENCPK